MSIRPLGRGRGVAAAASLAALLALSGCAGAMRIGTLLDESARWDGKSVRIAGQVTDAVGVLGLGGYRLDDGTGTITVVSRSGGAPRSGARVEVQGIFRVGFTLGTQTLSVVEEEKRTTK